MSPKSLSVVARLTAAALAFLAVGAAPAKKSGPGMKAPETCKTFRGPQVGSKDAIEVTFLGVGGFLIRWAGQSVMTPPLYSNQRLEKSRFQSFTRTGSESIASRTTR
jgi:hypothetical protein